MISAFFLFNPVKYSGIFPYVRHPERIIRTGVLELSSK